MGGAGTTLSSRVLFSPLSQVPYMHVSGPHGCPSQSGKDVYVTHENLTNSWWGGHAGNAPCENPRWPPSGEQGAGASEKRELGTLSADDLRPIAAPLAVEKERASSILSKSTTQPCFVTRPGGCGKWACFHSCSASRPQGHLGRRGLSRGEGAVSRDPSFAPEELLASRAPQTPSLSHKTGAPRPRMQAQERPQGGDSGPA